MKEWDEMFRRFGMGDMNDRLDRMFKDFLGTDESTPGAKVWGYTMYRGPDGVPHVREFGTGMGEDVLPEKKEGVREPFADVTHEGDELRIVVELPGVSKEDIDLHTTVRSMTVSVDTESRKYHKVLKLPAEVDADSARAEYNNGILEVLLKTANPEPAPRKINIL